MDQHVQIQQQHPAEHQPTTNTNTSGSTNNLANNKENNPMCLINNLAQYNKIQYQYLRSGEQGPAHNKLYTVTLKLGEEEYQAENTTIKKAQRSAAAMALQHTQFKHPLPKAKRNNTSNRVTPTVELNTLAMKRRERVVYVLDDRVPALQAQGYRWQPRQHNTYGLGQPLYNYDPRDNNYVKNYNAHHQTYYYGENRYHHPPGEPFSVRLHVGERRYSGMGYNIQAARHDAASKAIEDIKQQEMDDNQQCPFVNENASSPTETFNELNTKIKSPISLVHEIASKRNFNVIFEVLSEKGPCHMKVFVTQCRVGDLIAKGEGNSKAISKRRAAEKMLEELKKLGPLPNTTNLAVKKDKRVVNSMKQRNLIKDNSNQNSDYSEEINPVSHLTQIQQTNKEKEPAYHVTERDAHQLVADLLSVDDRFGTFQQPRAILGRSEMSNSGSVSASTEVNKTDQVNKKSAEVTQSVGAKNQLKTKRHDNVTANKASNAESACRGSTAKHQVVPKAKPN